MKDIFNSVYREDYLQGYSKGLNPRTKVAIKQKNEAFNDGFNAGRLDYESWNGSISDGIPKRIVTQKVLEEFLLSGMLGLNIDTDNYSPFQLNVLSKWYQSGTEKYDIKQSLYLFSVLEENGILVKNETFYL